MSGDVAAGKATIILDDVATTVSERFEKALRDMRSTFECHLAAAEQQERAHEGEGEDSVDALASDIAVFAVSPSQ